VIEEFGKYMNKHRVQANGTVRASDNWQKGMPQEQYMKSGWRHFMDLWKAHRGLQSVPIPEACCALMFNVMGYLHETLTREVAAEASAHVFMSPAPITPAEKITENVPDAVPSMRYNPLAKLFHVK